jgi:hypothetical protein
LKLIEFDICNYNQGGLEPLDIITDPQNKISQFGGSDAGGGKKLIPFTF